MNIRKIREKKKISQRTLSEMSNVPQPTLASYESQTRVVDKPSKDHLKRLAKALNVSVEDLLEDDKPEIQMKCLNRVCLLNKNKTCINPLVLEGRAPCHGRHRISEPDAFDPYNKLEKGV